MDDCSGQKHSERRNLYRQHYPRQANHHLLQSQYNDVLNQLHNLQANLSDDSNVLTIAFTDIQYLNNASAQVHLATRLQSEHVNDQVEIVLEFHDTHVSFPLEKTALGYEADFVLPLEDIVDATVIVTNGDNITNYSCFIDDQDFELKRSLSSQWGLAQLETFNDHLVAYTMTYEENDLYPVPNIQFLEIEDEKGNVVKKMAFPEDPVKFEIDFDIHKQEGNWNILTLHSILCFPIEILYL